MKYTEEDLPLDYHCLTWDERREVRKLYINIQKNKCLFCGEDLDKDAPKEIIEKKIDWSLFPSNFLQYSIHLQHNHETGKTEGAVHNYCNAVMWQYHKR